MGSVISQGADGLGSVIGNAFTAPLKGIFGRSCEDVCSGPWDVMCFIEHFCILSLAKLLLILVLCYITLLFIYLLFKLGICQCIGRSLCKMCWLSCETYWYALEHITCYLYHKLISTKRVYRGRRHRFQDVELGYNSSTDESGDDSYSYINHSQVSRNKRKSLRERRNYDHLGKSLYLSSSRHGSVHKHHHNHARLKGRSSRRLMRSRQIQLNKGRNQLRKAKKPRIFKRQRLK